MEKCLSSPLHACIILIILTQQCFLASSKRFGCASNERSTSIYEKIYGEPVKPMKFKNMEEFDALQIDLTELNQNILEYYVSTQVEDFIRFYCNYRLESNETGMGFVNYFLKYDLVFDYQLYPGYYRPNNYGLEIEFLELLVAHNKKVKNHIYLCAVGKEKLAYGYFQPQYVAAILRFQYPESKRLGYLVVHPSAGLPRPYIIFDDKLPPSDIIGDFNIAGERYISHLHLSLQTDLTDGTHYLVASNQRYDRGIPAFDLPYVYDISKPFCSYMNILGKTKFFSNIFTVMKQDRNGSPIAKILVDTQTLQVHYASTDKSKVIPLDTDIEKLEEDYDAVLREVLATLAMTRGYLKYIMESFVTILGDKVFTKGISSVAKRWEEGKEQYWPQWSIRNFAHYQ